MSHPVIKLKNVVKDDYSYNEAINTLRTNIQFCGSNIKKIMFTSSLPDEGKSDVSFALGYSLAQIGKRVLMIDADIRKSVLVFRYHPDIPVGGLSQYLSGHKDLDEIIYEAEDTPNFHMIFAGPYSPNPAVLLEEDLFAQIFESKEAEYDYIIVDTPPMANLIDGALVARQCDGAVLVIESGAISYRLEQKVKEQLEMSGCRILGVVLNKVNMNQRGYYGKYGKYGKYDKYEYGPDHASVRKAKKAGR